MGNLKEVAYDIFKPSVPEEEYREEEENVDPNAKEALKIKPEQQPIIYDNNIKNGHPITIASVRIDFPLKPYPAQVQMMSKIINALNKHENAVLESPTGSGKSLALLCATLAWRQKEENLAIQKLLAKNEKEGHLTSNETIKDNNNKREREDQESNTDNGGTLNVNQSSDSIDSDFQTQPRSEEKRPKFTDVIDVEDSVIEVAERPRRAIPPSIKRFTRDNFKKSKPSNNGSFVQETPASSSLKRFTLENFKKNEQSDSGSFAQEKPASPSSSRPLSESNLKYQTFNQIPRIFVGSRTHKQLTQLVQELKDNTSYRPRMTMLASREQLCVHPTVSKSKTKTDDCNNLLDKKACIYAMNTHKLVSHTDLKTINRVWDIEDLVKLGKKIKGCPYYAARKMYEGAEIVFCPYNYIIDPIIRSVLDIQIKNSIVIIDEAHNIEDASRAAGSFEVNENELKILSFELTQVRKEGYEPEAHNHMLYFVESLLEWISNKNNVYTIEEYEQHVSVWSGGELLQKLEALGIKASTFNDVIKPAFKQVYSHAQEIRKEQEEDGLNNTSKPVPAGEVQVHERKCVSNNGLSVLQALIMILGFFFEENKSYSVDYRMALIKKIERGAKKFRRSNKKAKTKVSAELTLDPSEWNYKLCFWCLNPGAIFRQLTEDTHSVILTSGTLSPMNTFESELETKFNGQLEANHVIAPSQVWVGTIPVGPNNVPLKGTYNNIESFQYQDDIGEALYQILESVPFGVLCFFSSYKSLEKLTERWKLTGLYERMEEKKLVLLEPRSSGKNDLEKVMKKYNERIKSIENQSTATEQTGALLMGVFRGKISEGIDFTDNSCRAVVSIGIPYPGLKDVQVNLKKGYNDQKKAHNPGKGVLSGSEWYSTQAYRAINQALGRCIRHRNDWGAIILLEERFQYKEHIDRLSKWIKNQHKNYQNYNMAINSLNEFASKHSRADSEARKALVTDSANQVLAASKRSDTVKEESATVPIITNLFDGTNNVVKNGESSKSVKVETVQLKKTSIPTSNINNNDNPNVQSRDYKLDSLSVTAAESRVPEEAWLMNDMELDDPTPTEENLNSTHNNSNNNNNNTNKNNHDSKQKAKETVFMNNDDEEDFSFEFPLDIDFDMLPSSQVCTKTSDISQNQYNNNNTTTSSSSGLAVATAQSAVIINKKEIVTELPASVPIPLPSLLPSSSKLAPIPTQSSSALSQNNSSTINQVVELIKCENCNLSLISGFARDRQTIANQSPLSCVSFYSNNTPYLVELIKPGSWIIQDNNMVGGPLGANVLPNRYPAEVDRRDGLCFHVLKCKCNLDKTIGVVICDALDGGKKEYVGKVYLWLDAIQITTRKPVVIPQARSTMERDDEPFLSSQVSNMNDLFYNLP